MLLGLALPLLSGCRTPSGQGQAASWPDRLDPNTPSQAVGGSGHIVAYVHGRPIHRTDLLPGLIEAAGGTVLAEQVLDQMIHQRLTGLGQVVEPEHIDQERALLAHTLDSDDPNRAQRLLRQLRQRRGLGEHRFQRLLVRNAGLRLLVQDQVEISDAAVQQAYRLEHGDRHEVRLIVTDSLVQATGLIRRIHAGESFIDLAIAHSTDASRAQGGLLGLISLADPTFPKAVRTTVAGLQTGQVGGPVALDDGFAVLKLERIEAGNQIAFDQVRSALRIRVRRQVERMLMQRQVRAMLNDADVIVLDPLLETSWRAHHRQMLKNPQR